MVTCKGGQNAEMGVLHIESARETRILDLFRDWKQGKANRERVFTW
jgi:hypothetical protein